MSYAEANLDYDYDIYYEVVNNNLLWHILHNEKDSLLVINYIVFASAYDIIITLRSVSICFSMTSDYDLLPMTYITQWEGFFTCY